ncbi:E3 ubiquitin-protein ligase DMA1/2 [Entomortierella parvispora]|uniref:E3 ubiquitin-protein ligase DMA1/2 n=1 Tax=Entomortierella parvispora TaxID=205924 RepID=A0A9P3H7K5_9FUNG|nr:E3 ubiquitin-protein ligase DMA1/2 [Entomortierella parvispora]
MNQPSQAQPGTNHLNGHAHQMNSATEPQEQPGSSIAAGTSAAPAAPPVPHIRIVPHLDAPRSLHFEVVDKDVPQGFVLKIGRFTDKQALPNRVTFKSKVVSRGHAEIYTDQGKFYIRDTKSSSGTFLNHARLSPPGVESKPTQLKDGDVIQLGVDYQGGTQEIYRCVKMRLELNRSWQQQANPFRLNTLKAIRSLTTANAASSTDCCICLFRIASFQSLFVAPCSHVYHFKCIRPLLMAHHPGFQCPLCRTFADLEDSVEIDDPIEEEVPVEVYCVLEIHPTEAVAAIERATSAQEVVAQPLPIAQDEPLVEPQMADPSTEEVYAPTPPSEQAHTFQPPNSESYASNHTQQHQEEPRNHESQPVEGNVISIESEQGASPFESEDDPTPTYPPSDVTAPAHIDFGSSHVDVPGQSVSISTEAETGVPADAPVQQFSSSAFFMAPSPPNSGSYQRSGPTAFGSPPSTTNRQPTQQQQVPVSPSNHVTAAISNFVRNISIPTRHRSRTNSNSPLNPMVQNGSGSSGPSAASGHIQIQGLAPNHSGGQGDSHADVFGKTLVVTPPPMTVGGHARNTTGEEGSSLQVNYQSQTPAIAEIAEFEPTSNPGPESLNPHVSVEDGDTRMTLNSQDHSMSHSLPEQGGSVDVGQQQDHQRLIDPQQLATE